MRELDKVIGYESIKQELYKIIDILKNPKKYEDLGVTMPKGLLLDGEPGIGKTLMAKSFIKDVGWNSYVIRKDQSDGAFVDHIREVFKKAADNAPSLILLDDLDKFANEDQFHRNAEEYVTVQSCIDEVKDKNVYIVATSNESLNLPDSLIRSGRFDKSFDMSFPKNEDAKNIISFYLKHKKVEDEIDIDEIARFSEGHSCADLEKVINEAGIYSGYDNKPFIGQDDLRKACLRELFNISEIENTDCLESLRRRAVHEAGHAVIAEAFFPGIVTFASIQCSERGTGGKVHYRTDDYFYEKYKNQEIDIMIKLGGKAATEIVLNEIDMGTNWDLRSAYREVAQLLDNVAAYDFMSWCHGEETSSRVFDHLDDVKGTEMTRYYLMTKQILGKNRAFLDEMINRLLEKKTLTYKDIEPIREKYLMKQEMI